MTSALVHTTSTPAALVIRMADALSVPDGGFSVDPRTGGDVRTGYAVAVFPERERQIGGRVNPADVLAYVLDNADKLAGNGVVVGGWRNPDDGLAYLDISRTVGTREEAAELARDHNQLAYFDFSAGASVSV